MLLHGHDGTIQLIYSQDTRRPLNGHDTATIQPLYDHYTATTVTDLDFADDLALLSNTIQDAQSLLHDLEVAAEQVGRFRNASKTECMIMKRPPSLRIMENHWSMSKTSNS